MSILIEGGGAGSGPGFLEKLGVATRKFYSDFFDSVKNESVFVAPEKEIQWVKEKVDKVVPDLPDSDELWLVALVIGGVLLLITALRR
jgi:hypothetical protein